MRERAVRQWRVLVVASMIPALSGLAQDPGLPAQSRVRRGYVDGRFGQMHYRQVAGPSVQNLTPLVLFHPTALSSDYFKLFLPVIGRDRRAIAIDTPGYGESDPPPEPQPIETLAAAMADALDAFGFGSSGAGQIDLMGIHTGSLVAGELAVQRPDLVRRVILSGVPLFLGEERTTRYEQLIEPYKSLDPADHSHIMRFWRNTVENRQPALSVERAVEHAYDQYLSGQRFWWAFHAVMRYATEERMPLIEQPVLVLNIHDNLAEHNRKLLPLLQKGRLVELPELTFDAFDLNADRIARETRAFLDASPAPSVHRAPGPSH